MTTLFLIMYFLAILFAMCMLGILYYVQISKRFIRHGKSKSWRKFFMNPGVIILHLSWLYLVGYGIFVYIVFVPKVLAA